MGWSGGTYTRTNGTYSGANVWASDEGASIGIESARHDTHDKDLSDGINACLAKNGSNAATADLNLGSFKVTALANGTARTHAASVGQVQDSAVQWGGVATGTANAIAIACPISPGSYAAGQTFRFVALYANTSATTINVNSLGAKDVYKEVNGVLGNIGAGDIAANGLYELTYYTGGAGYFTLQTCKPGKGTFTHNFAPNAGGWSSGSALFYYARNGQAVHVTVASVGLQTGSTAANYTFSLPVTIAAAINLFYTPVVVVRDGSVLYGLLAISGATATVTAGIGGVAETFAAGQTVQVFGSFTYFVD